MNPIEVGNQPDEAKLLVDYEPSKTESSIKEFEPGQKPGAQEAQLIAVEDPDVEIGPPVEFTPGLFAPEKRKKRNTLIHS